MRHVAACALVIAVCCGLLAPQAAARTGLAFSPQQSNFMTASMTFEPGLGSGVTCSVALQIAMHRVSKSVGTLAGHGILGVDPLLCGFGRAGILVGGTRALGTQVYHLTYSSFTGTLPNITSITFVLNDVVFWIEVPRVVECLTAGGVDIVWTTGGGNPATSLTGRSTGIPLTGSFLCLFASGEITASATLSPSIRMTLL